MMGFDKLVWFMGVVEDDQDPTYNGRIKVRAFNVHPSDKEDVPTKHLPWATVIDGTYGSSHIIPPVGDWVFGFFIDGIECNHPMVIGRIPGQPLQLPEGSTSPGESAYIPVETLKNFGKPPLNRYIGGEDCEIGPAAIQASAQKNGIKTAIFKTKKALDEKDEEKRVKFSEPNILTPEKNFDSTVIKSKHDNNVIVLNDYEDGEGTSILICHSTGSVFQIDPNGTIFVKSFGDTYNSTEGFEFNRIDKDSHTNVGGDWSLKIEGGSGRIEVQGDLDISCNNFNVDARASANIHAGTSVNISGAKVGMIAIADDVNISALNQVKVQTTGPAGNIVMKAPFGDLNVDAYAMNVFSQSYIGMTSLALPDFLALPPFGTPNILGPPPPKILSGIEFNTLTYMNMWALTDISMTAIGAATISAGGKATMQSVISSSMISAGSANISAGLSASMFGVLSSKMSSFGTSTVWAGKGAAITGLATVDVFSGGKTSVTGVKTVGVSGLSASVSGAKLASLNSLGKVFVGGVISTLLGVPGKPAIPAVPALPGAPSIPTPIRFPIPAFVNLAEFGAAVIPDEMQLGGIRPYVGFKADNRLGTKTPINITSRSTK